MKLKALSLALLALPIASFAEGPVDNYLPQVSFTVESEKKCRTRFYCECPFFTKRKAMIYPLSIKPWQKKMNKAIELTKSTKCG